MGVRDCVEIVGGVPLAVRFWTPDARSGAPIVLLHEGLGCIEMWKAFPEAMATATGREVIAYDREGFGRSGRARAARFLDYMHESAWTELPALLRQLDIERPVLFGHSDGGTIALLYAARYPVEALVVEAAHIWVEDEALAGIRAAVADRDQLIERLRRYHGDQTEAVFDRWSGTWLAPWFRSWSIAEHLGAIECPTVALQGADDHYASDAHLDAIVQRIPTAEGHLIPDVGHAPHREAEEQVLELTARLLV
jgi:pimeloyl-ACP methyl ester carboxylesterase